MKKILALQLFIIVSTCLSWGQNEYLDLIKKGQFSSVEKKTNKTLRKNSEDINANYAKALLLTQKEYDGYNPDSAYRYIQITQQLFNNIKDKEELKALRKLKINQSTIKNTINTIYKCAMDSAVSENTKDGYIRFLDNYQAAGESYKLKAHEKIDLIDYKALTDTNSTATYQDFIDKHTPSKATGLAQERLCALAFDKADSENTKKAYKDFIDKYPKSKQYSKALQLYKQIQYHAKTPSDKWYQYKIFIEKHPLDQGVSAAQDSILSIGLRTNDLNILQYCIKHFDTSRRNTALSHYYNLYTDDGETQTLNLFFNTYKDDIFSKVKAKDYRIADLGDSLSVEMPYNPKNYTLYNRYIRLAGSKEKAFVALQKMIAHNISTKQWKMALDTVVKYKPFFGANNVKINDLISLLEAKWDNTVKINSVGNGVNTTGGGEYVPVISADDKSLYFCGIHRMDSIGMEDIYVASKTANGWGDTKIIKELSYPNTNDAPLSVSADGTKMLLFISGKLNYSEKTKQGWGLPKPFPWIINSEKWQADAMITSDGKALLFASVREGGYNIPHSTPYHGANHYAADIYVSVLNDKNEWEMPINLGPAINTKYCDRMPFLHPDMKTLYFSSDGHGGLGLLDVYKTTRLADSCWDCWSEPVNLGKEINTEGNDWGYKISTDGDKAYFAKGSGGESTNDIYYLNLPNSMRPNFVATISGKLSNKLKQGVSADIFWEDLETGKVVGKSKSDPINGSYFIVLPLGKIYGYYVEEDTYYPASNNIDLRNNNTAIKVQADINMTAIKDMIADGTPVPITNLFFNFSESTLLPYSIPELQRVARIIKSNNLKVEISGHTDNVGDPKKNQTLSEQRAAAVKDFLVKEGCLADMLVTKGYGETKPIVSNSTDAGRAKNRRVELRFVK